MTIRDILTKRAFVASTPIREELDELHKAYLKILVELVNHNLDNLSSGLYPEDVYQVTLNIISNPDCVNTETISSFNSNVVVNGFVTDFFKELFLIVIGCEDEEDLRNGVEVKMEAPEDLRDLFIAGWHKYITEKPEEALAEIGLKDL